MEKQRKYKLFSIIALMFAIVGMSLGYAAFSKVLTITASATVTPNEEDFKVVTYGLKDEEAYWNFDGSRIFSNESLSDNISFGYHTADTTTGTIANITNNKNNTIINNINISFSEEYAEFQYYFIIKNEGKYDAYIDLTESNYYELKNDYKGTCTAIEENADQKAIEEVCNNTQISIMGYKSDNDYIVGTEEEPYYKLEVGDYIYLQVIIYTKENAVILEPYNVNFEDIRINFSSSPNKN